MTLRLEKIDMDQGAEIKKHRLVLYSNDYMRDEILNIKKNELYYIVDDIPIGYIHMTPHTMPISGIEYMLIYEIEIFEMYRSSGYGSKIIKQMRSQHEIIPVDIQEKAMNFWFRHLDNTYWKRLISEYGDVKSLSQRLLYSDIVTRHISEIV